VEPDRRDLRRVDYAAPTTGFPAAGCCVCDLCPSAVSVRLRAPVHPAGADPGGAVGLGPVHYFCQAHRGAAERLHACLVRTAGPAPSRSPLRPAGVVPLPVRLPERFVERVGYPGEDRVVGLHWFAVADLLVAYGAGRLVVDRLRAGPWRDLLDRPLLVHWLREHDARLGSARILATHHLLVDRVRNAGFLARADEARRLVERQCLPLDEA
jgi:hypothetical protein